MTQMAPDANHAIIVLAAGRSSRMGQHKLLLPLGEEPLVAHAVRAACASLATHVVVVLGHDAERVHAALPSGRYEPVVNPDYASGMASSLRAGLAALLAGTGATRTPSSPLGGVLITLADQPLAAVGLLNALLTAAATASPDAIIAASAAGLRGNPVYFPALYFDELAQVRGDEGGRAVIVRHLDQLQLLDWPDTNVFLDVDQPGDYERVRALWPRYSAADRDDAGD
ncbi:MAG: NTP transferase domain-containing protein [Ktedonobacterales bacterium]